MKARYWPCLGVNSARATPSTCFIVVVGSGELTAMLGGGSHPARKLKRAQILLAADAGVGDEAIAASVCVGGSTVYRTKRRFVEGNLNLALSEAARPGAARKLSGREAALLVATASLPACGPQALDAGPAGGRAGPAH